MIDIIGQAFGHILGFLILCMGVGVAIASTVEIIKSITGR